MKLSVVFAKYLYQNKQLNLPGIGTFSVDPSLPVPEISDKNFQEYLQHITFSQKFIARPDTDFIEFIRVQTGKIKPLAESDLESFLSDGKILLNIGKPFHLEGIGTLQKNKAGTYDFIPGEPVMERLEGFRSEKSEERTAKRKSLYENDYGGRGQNTMARKVLIIVAIIIGLVAVIWGGYTLYNKKAEEKTQLPVNSNTIDTSLLATNDTLQSSADSAQLTKLSAAPGSVPPGSYKFVIETTGNRTRMTKRFNQLKSFYVDIKVDSTTNSGVYKLYFVIPAQATDTSRIKDSLRRMFASKSVAVEQ